MHMMAMDDDHKIIYFQPHQNNNSIKWGKNNKKKWV